MTLDELQDAAEAGQVDTVVVALVDMQGRLQGKRLSARHFLDEAVRSGLGCCSYLLAADVDMTPVEGYRLSSWQQGYGDFVMRPDLGTLRRLPWHPATALCLTDVEWEGAGSVEPAPRHVLKQQLARLDQRGLRAIAATELEFIAFHDSYDEAWSGGYRDMRPTSSYNIDYSLGGTGAVEPLMRRLRNEMTAAGMAVEASKGECNRGQHEINFRHAPALTTADHHAIYKAGAKEIAAQERMSITFMAKFDAAEGSSCHIHMSLTDGRDSHVLAQDRRTFERFLAGQIACARELTLLYAPNVNSYKRFADRSFAPTAVTWGHDNRTCAFRVVGEGGSLRVENRIPGADVNPHLALGAMIAAGLHGIDAGLELEPAATGDAYGSDAPRLPRTLGDARELFATSEVARAAFGDEVVDHYSNCAAVELSAFEGAVTDWERTRGFERL